jgi:hypothetical protein
MKRMKRAKADKRSLGFDLLSIRELTARAAG